MSILFSSVSASSVTFRRVSVLSATEKINTFWHTFFLNTPQVFNFAGIITKKLLVLSQQLAVELLNLGHSNCCWSWYRNSSCRVEQNPPTSPEPGAGLIQNNGWQWFLALLVRVEAPLVHACFAIKGSFQSQFWQHKAPLFSFLFFFFSISVMHLLPQASGNVLSDLTPTDVVSFLLQPILEHQRFSRIHLLSCIQETTITWQAAEQKQRLTFLILEIL